MSATVTKISNNRGNSPIKKPYTVYIQHQMIGKGGFGEVYDVTEKESGEHFALKCCSHIFDHPHTTHEILRELLFGRLLNNPYVMSIKEILVPASLSQFNTIWFITDKMKFDMRRMFINNTSYTLSNIKYMMFQLFHGVDYLHRAGVIHRDLKPENILFSDDNNFSLKIGDFGLACIPNINKKLTTYTVTRWYRAPELLLECHYNESIDIWSLGCILAELLLNGHVLFKGKNQYQQLEMIISLLGTPLEDDDDDEEWISNSYSKRLLIKKFGNRKGNFNSTFTGCNAEAVDLLSHLLRWDPKDRYTAAEALKHPFFDDIMSSCGELIPESVLSPKEVEKIDFGYDESALFDYQLQSKIVDEIKYYHPYLDSST